MLETPLLERGVDMIMILLFTVELVGCLTLQLNDGMYTIKMMSWSIDLQADELGKMTTFPEKLTRFLEQQIEILQGLTQMEILLTLDSQHQMSALEYHMPKQLMMLVVNGTLILVVL